MYVLILQDGLGFDSSGWPDTFFVYPYLFQQEEVELVPARLSR
jgi:hypothetical protein